MTHPTSSTSGTPNMASLLARVQPEPTPDPRADSTETPKTAAGFNGKPSTTFAASRASSGAASPADGTTKGVPVKRLLVWAVPLVFLAVGAAVMHQSQAAGTIFLLLAFVALIVVLIAKWLGKRRAARSAANGGPGANGPSRGRGAGRSPARGRGPDGGRGPGGGGRGGGLRGKLNPFRKRSAAGGPGPAAGGRAPAGGKPPAGGPGMPGGRGGMFSKLNPFSKSGSKPAAAGTPGSKPGVKTPPGAKGPAGGKAPGSTGSPTGSPAGAPAGPKGLRGKLRNLLPSGLPRTPGGGKSPAGGRAPSGGKTPGGRGGPGGPGAVGGGNGGLLRGLLGAKTPAAGTGASSGAPELGVGGGGRFGRFRNRLGRFRNRLGRFRNRPKASDNPNNWRNSGSRWEQRLRPFRRRYDVPRDLGATGQATSTDGAGGTWTTREGSGYRGGGQRESFATPNSGGSSPRQNPDGSYNAEFVDDHEPPRQVVKVHAERVDQPTSNSPRPIAPAPTGLGPATNTSSTESSGGNTMAHTDQQTGARSATILEAGATTARAGAARKENIAATHRRQAAAASGIPEMANDAAILRAQAARASADAGARRGIAGAFSQAAATHRSN